MTRPTAEERARAVAYDIVAPRSRWTTKWLPDGDYVWADDAVSIAEKHAAAETEALRAQLRIVRRILAVKFEQAAKGVRPDTIVLCRAELALQGLNLHTKETP